MSEPYLGEIRMFGGNFAPRGWALCNGQIMAISTNTALFSILGTTYGGDGQTTFKLPDFRGRAPLHWGQGPGLSIYDLGQVGGIENTTLLSSNMPIHNHQAVFTPTGGGGSATSIAVAGVPGTLPTPVGNIIAEYKSGLNPVNMFAPASAATGTLAGVTGGGGITGGTVTVGNAGGSLPFSLLNPYLVVTFIIALNGIFPSRN